jgi:hypothetical protein
MSSCINWISNGKLVRLNFNSLLEADEWRRIITRSHQIIDYRRAEYPPLGSGYSQTRNAFAQRGRLDDVGDIFAHPSFKMKLTAIGDTM